MEELFKGVIGFQLNHAIMFIVAFILIYLAIVKEYEPMLLLPIGFGAIMANIPFSSAIGHDGFLTVLYEFGIKTELFPILIFIAVGAMIDFSPLFQNPFMLFFGAAAQFGIFATMMVPLLLGFDLKEAASIGIIGAADGPTSIYVASKFAENLLAPISVAAYSYMSLVPIIQPPVIRMLTSRSERLIRMQHHDVKVPKPVKILFPIVITITAGIIAPIIPPSIPFVIFGVTANVSIGKLFLAGIVPGLMMGIACAIAWWLTARTEAVVTPPKATGATLMKAFRDSTWALVLPLIVLVGLKFGVFTPTEAAVVAAVYAFFVATVVYRELSLKQLYEVFAASAKTTSIIMFMVAAAAVSAWLIAVADLPSQLISILEPFMQSPTTLLCILMLVLLMVGMVMDLTPTILILAPVMVPVVKAAGIDPVYFGVLFVMVGVIGLVTPPVGTVLNVVAGVGKMKMDQVARGVMPFLIADVIVLFLLVMFPALVLAPLDFFYK
jgi:tripartite ATP-independent transporter DctM subunit